MGSSGGATPAPFPSHLHPSLLHLGCAQDQGGQEPQGLGGHPQGLEPSGPGGASPQLLLRPHPTCLPSGFQKKGPETPPVTISKALEKAKSLLPLPFPGVTWATQPPEEGRRDRGRRQTGAWLALPPCAYRSYFGKWFASSPPGLAPAATDVPQLPGSVPQTPGCGRSKKAATLRAWDIPQATQRARGSRLAPPPRLLAVGLSYCICGPASCSHCVTSSELLHPWGGSSLLCQQPPPPQTGGCGPRYVSCLTTVTAHPGVSRLSEGLATPAHKPSKHPGAPGSRCPSTPSWPPPSTTHLVRKHLAPLPPSPPRSPPPGPRDTWPAWLEAPKASVATLSPSWPSPPDSTAAQVPLALSPSVKGRKELGPGLRAAGAVSWC